MDIYRDREKCKAGLILGNLNRTGLFRLKSCQQQMNLSGSVANELSAFCDDLPKRRKAEGEARSL